MYRRGSLNVLGIKRHLAGPTVKSTIHIFLPPKINVNFRDFIRITTGTESR